MRTLVLTSPHMKGQDVKDAQKILKQSGYYHGKVDGDYGPVTGNAAAMAKWTIGYAEKKVTTTCGSSLIAFLTDKRKPTLLMKQRAKQRLKKSYLGEKAILVAGQYEGVSEDPPGSNEVLFSRWYGIIGPWCAMFVTYCMVSAGSKGFKRGSYWAYCPFMLADAKANRNGLTLIKPTQVQPGDVVLFDWNHDGTADHVGLTTSTVKNGSFTTIEGNTSGTNPSDGGSVARKSHDLSNVIAFIRVLY